MKYIKRIHWHQHCVNVTYLLLAYPVGADLGQSCHGQHVFSYLHYTSEGVQGIWVPDNERTKFGTNHFSRACKGVTPAHVTAVEKTDDPFSIGSSGSETPPMVVENLYFSTCCVNERHNHTLIKHSNPDFTQTNEQNRKLWKPMQHTIPSTMDWTPMNTYGWKKSRKWGTENYPKRVLKQHAQTLPMIEFTSDFALYMTNKPHQQPRQALEAGVSIGCNACTIWLSDHFPLLNESTASAEVRNGIDRVLPHTHLELSCTKDMWCDDLQFIKHGIIVRPKAIALSFHFNRQNKTKREIFSLWLELKRW
jgi:hypothetical protein